jgi:hypothetical protein
VILGQEAGTTVHYFVIANDTLENTLTVSGIYTVKYPSTLNFTSTQDNARPGEEITFKGTLTPAIKDMPVTIYFVSANATNVTACFTSEDGTFSGSFKPETVGTWVVYASFNGSATVYDSQTSMTTLRVEETMFSKYSLYIFGGIGAVTAVGIVIYIKKSKA